MSSVPNTTVILTTFRRPELLQRAMLSVLGQTCADFRLVVYDNGSGDSTGDVVRQFAAADPRVRLVQRDYNIPPYANVSDAIARVETPFFTICADDDFLFPQHLSTLLPLLQADEDLAYAFGSFLYVSLDGEILNLAPGHWPLGRSEAGEAALHTIQHGHVAWQAALFRTRLIQEAGGGPTQSVGLIGDVDFLLKLGTLFPVYASAEAVAVHSCHPQQGGAKYDLGETRGLVTMYRRLGRMTCGDGSQRRMFIEILRRWVVQFLCSLALVSARVPSSLELARSSQHLLLGLGEPFPAGRFLLAAMLRCLGSNRVLDPIRRQVALEATWLTRHQVQHVRSPDLANNLRAEVSRLARHGASVAS
jgi:glycosyltransferase involved in cell wall biosynthesis